MIIRHPTGLYENVGQLPLGLASGNVTWTISTEDPNRAVGQSFLKLPLSEEIRPTPARIHSNEQRRAQLGELVFSITEGRRVEPGSNTKLFEVGQQLTFDDVVSSTDVTRAVVPETIEIRHDQNILDLQKAGLSDEQIDFITAQSRARADELSDLIADLQVEIKSIEVQIAENQKQINETNKILQAVLELSLTGTGVEEDLQARLSGLLEERDALTVELTEANAQVEAANQSLLTVSQLVR